MKSLLTFAAGILFLALGLLGLLLPVLPGVLFLLVAAVCFASASPALRDSMRKHPRLARLLARLDAGQQLHIGARGKLAFWALLEAANPRSRRPSTRSRLQA